jgi:hypothetical protein
MVVPCDTGRVETGSSRKIRGKIRGKTRGQTARGSLRKHAKNA